MDTFTRIYDESKGKSYILHKGVKYWLWENRGLYVSQIGGKQTMLHRLLYWDGDKGHEVVPIDKNWENLNPSNWENRKRQDHFRSEKEYRLFDNKRFYKKENGYWWSKVYGSMHKCIWQFYNGKVPKGYTIHHKDGNKDNNVIENLCILSASEHSKLHAKDNKWIGSAENKEQLRKANLKRWQDYRNKKKKEKETCL